MQGRTAVFHALGDVALPTEVRNVTSNIFTQPEIATVGWQQKDVEAGTVKGVVTVVPLKANPRAKMQGIRDGFVKLISTTTTGQILGGVVVGPRASDLILPISIAVEHRLTADQLARVFSVYPSLTGSITDAARAAHIVR
jgi:dihydrolipoamide dehydrogenase